MKTKHCSAVMDDKITHKKREGRRRRGKGKKELLEWGTCYMWAMLMKGHLSPLG